MGIAQQYGVKPTGDPKLKKGVAHVDEPRSAKLPKARAALRASAKGISGPINTGEVLTGPEKSRGRPAKGGVRGRVRLREETWAKLKATGNVDATLEMAIKQYLG